MQRPWGEYYLMCPRNRKKSSMMRAEGIRWEPQNRGSEDQAWARCPEVQPAGPLHSDLTEKI